MNYSKQIFEMLEVVPYEEFNLSNQAKVIKFRLLEDLTVQASCDSKWNESGVQIKSILSGAHKIIKIPHPTKKEQIAIDYGRACGFKWIAKDSQGNNYFFRKKPTKEIGCWCSCTGGRIVCYVDISFIHWEDDEPYYIGDKENEN